MNSNRDVASFLTLVFLMMLVMLFCSAIAVENLRNARDENIALKALPADAPALVLRCRDGFFYVESSYNNIKMPLMDMDYLGQKRQVPCTPAFEAIKMRKALGRQ